MAVDPAVTPQRPFIESSTPPTRSAASLSPANLHSAGFDTIMLPTATADRLLRHAHLIVTGGPSLRLAEATAGKGVVPLPRAAGRSARHGRLWRVPRCG